MRAQLILSHSPHFTQSAIREVERFCPCRMTPLADGVTQVTLETDPKPLLKKWRNRPPIYVQHVFPAQRSFRDLEALLKWCVSRLGGRKSFQLQSRCLDGPLVSGFAADLELRLVKASQILPLRSSPTVLSVVRHQGRYLAGISQARDNVSPFCGGAPALAPNPGQLNRAEPKLEEALHVFRLRHSKGRALDLGSSQGGWSRVLLHHGFEVVAVDPKCPEPALLDHPRFEHHALTAQEFLRNEHPPFDLITNDMIMWPAESARLMNLGSRLLKPRGCAIMTLKVGCQRRLANTDHALRLLRKSYKIPRIKQLYHNGMELTAWLTKPK